jgi:hypothetical protein
MLEERLEPLLPGLAVLQRDGVVSAVKVQIVERAMHKLTRPSLKTEAVQMAELLLTEQAPILAPAELQRFAHAVVRMDPGPLDRPRSTTPHHHNQRRRQDAA